MRTFDPAQFNAIANLPEVRWRLGGEGHLDLTNVILNPRNYAFQNDLGGFICMNTFGATYEVHTIFTPKRNGIEEIKRLMFRAELFMFTKTNCVELITKVPDGNRGAERLANTFGFIDVGRQVNWDKGVGAALKRKTLEDWAKGAPETYLAGRSFHDTLAAAKREQNGTAPPHDDDSTHDMIVGAAFLMAKGGQVSKGISFYNYWANFAGYAPVSLISESPPVLDIRDAVVGIEDGKLEVYLCR